MRTMKHGRGICRLLLDASEHHENGFRDQVAANLGYAVDGVNRMLVESYGTDLDR